MRRFIAVSEQKKSLFSLHDIQFKHSNLIKFKFSLPICSVVQVKLYIDVKRGNAADRLA